MSKKKPTSDAARVGVMFAIAGLCLLAGLATVAEEDEATWAEGRVVSKTCTTSDYDEHDTRYTTCEVRIAYQLDGQPEAVRASRELVKTFLQRWEPFKRDPGPREGATVRSGSMSPAMSTSSSPHPASGRDCSSRSAVHWSAPSSVSRSSAPGGSDGMAEQFHHA